MPTSPVIYARISQTDTRKGVERQIKILQREARELGLPECAVFMDNDLSSKEGVDRPDFNRMWDLIRAGVHDCILVWKLDRYSREPFHYDWIKKYTPIVITSGKRWYDPEQSEDMHALRSEAASAERETKRLSERLKGQRNEDAMSGLRHGAPAFGWGVLKVKGYDDEGKRITKWKKRDKPNPVEKAMILDGMAKVVAGDSLNSVVNAWNNSGVTTSRGAAWNTTSVKHVLMRWSNAGVRQHQGEPLFDVKTTWEPLCDLQTLKEVRAMLSANPRNTATSRARRHLLTGVLRCECGSTMKAQHIRSSARMVKDVEGQHPERVPTHYKCEGNGCGRSVPYTDAEKYVLSWLGNYLLFKGSGAFLSPEGRAKVTELTGRLNALEEDRRKINALDLGVVDRASLLSQVHTQEKSVWAVLDTLSTQNALGRLVADLLPIVVEKTVSLEKSVENRRAIIERFRTLDIKTQKTLLRELATYTVGIGFSEPDPVTGRRCKLKAHERIEIVPASETSSAG